MTSETSDPGAGAVAMAPPAWRRAHPAFMLTALVRNVRGFIIPIGIVVLGRGMEGGVASWLSFGITALVMAGAGLAGALSWWFYRYALTAEHLLVRSGVVSRQERTVPYQRIQTVDLEEAPMERLLGVTRMRVETAATGSGEGEVVIQAVARDDAHALRERLLRARREARGDITVVAGAAPAGGRAATMPAVEGELLAKLSIGQLLAAGATSGTIGPAAAILGVALQFAEDLVPRAWWEGVPWDDLGEAASSITVVVAFLFVIAVLSWLLAIGGTVLTFAGFELRRDDEHLVVQYGLLDRRRTTIPLRRIQAIRIEEGLLRQPFGLATVRFESAGLAGRDEGGSGVLFPLLPKGEVAALLRRAVPAFAVDVEHATLAPLPKRALPRYVVADLIWTAIGIAAFLLALRAWQDGLPRWSLTAVLLLPTVAVYDWFQFRDTGWALEGDHLLLRWRSAARVTLVTQRRRIQHRSTTANPFQRRAGLVTFHAAVAAGGDGGRYALRHLDRAAGERLLVALSRSAAP